jgi:nitronate monooxygenase
MRIDQICGVKYPLIQSPMAGSQNSALTIAVSEAGAIGSLPCGLLDCDQLEIELSQIKKHTNKPFNINFLCFSEKEIRKSERDKWHAQFDRYINSISEDGIKTSSSKTRTPFNVNHLDIIKKFNPPLISFHFGLPEKPMVNELKKTGALILATATTLKEALWLEEKGVDILIVQGIEAGGHRGMFLSQELSTQKTLTSLIKDIKNKINVPIVAAGGISSPELVHDLLSKGVSGVQIGTSFLLCDEATTSPVHREALKNKKYNQTVVTNIFSGRNARSLKNKIIHELGPINNLAVEYPYASLPTSILRNHYEKKGIGDYSPLWCGDGKNEIKDGSAKEIIKYLTKNIIDKI